MDFSERVASIRDRLRSVVARRWFLVLLVASAAYLLTYVILVRSAHYHRQSDFFGNSSRSWVQLGAMRFPVDRFDTFMGVVFHPVLITILAIPVLLVSAFVLSLVLALTIGMAATPFEERAEERRVKARRQHEEEMARIAAEGRRALILAGAGGATMVRRFCSTCGSDVDGSGPECKNCGKSWME